jgi:hypothetical protein
MSTAIALEYDLSVETLEKSLDFLEVIEHEETVPSFDPDRFYKELIEQFSYPQAPLNFRAHLRKNSALWREIRKLEEQVDGVWIRFKSGGALKETLQDGMTQLKETLMKGLEFVKNRSAASVF